MNRFHTPSVRSVAFSILAQLAHGFKVSCIIGSYTAWFSLSAVIVPLAGVYCGLWASSAVVAVGLLFRFLLYEFSLPFHYLAYHIPGLFAAYYWSFGRALRVTVPLLCMILFMAHPEGGKAWLYAMYWWIPCIVAGFTVRSFFANALASTFTAHAVGSVIWIYTKPMTSTDWLSLIPMVALERFTFALGITVLYYAISYVAARLRVPFASFRSVYH